MTPEEQFLLDTPEFAALSSPETQTKRNEMRLAILEAEQKALTVKDPSLEGDIKKQKANMSGYGGFPNFMGLDVEDKKVDYADIVNKINKEAPINISAITTTDTTEKFPSKEEINKMSFYDVNKLREKYKGNEKAQELLGSREHFLFMEDIIRKNPEAAIGAAAATVGYQAIKTTNVGRELVKTTEDKASPASLEQLKGGLEGIVSGFGLYATEELLSMLGIETKKE